MYGSGTDVVAVEFDRGSVSGRADCSGRAASSGGDNG